MGANIDRRTLGRLGLVLVSYCEHGRGMTAGKVEALAQHEDGSVWNEQRAGLAAFGSDNGVWYRPLAP